MYPTRRDVHSNGNRNHRNEVHRCEESPTSNDVAPQRVFDARLPLRNQTQLDKLVYFLRKRVIYDAAAAATYDKPSVNLNLIFVGPYETNFKPMAERFL
ncbi:unnamed protein product [Soboliphyme baturini]|uniref:Doublecortin domain-containing protein n=1 Tax=Soboliphyme baturini TaxID=241478 RepID=A0A183J8I6_9BILA|nr:unnamed protein product [Soboliphyme baturini]